MVASIGRLHRTERAPGGIRAKIDRGFRRTTGERHHCSGTIHRNQNLFNIAISVDRRKLTSHLAREGDDGRARRHRDEKFSLILVKDSAIATANNWRGTGTNGGCEPIASRD